jgi:hypothetical protein
MPDIHDRQPFRAPDVAPRTGVSDDEAAAVRLANRFDIRRIIAGVFTVYGLVLLALGVFGAQHIKDKASGINVDLWTGAGCSSWAPRCSPGRCCGPCDRSRARCAARAQAGSAARRRRRPTTWQPPSATTSGLCSATNAIRARLRTSRSPMLDVR